MTEFFFGAKHPMGNVDLKRVFISGQYKIEEIGSETEFGSLENDSK
jgi:hypothetical protein